MLKPIDREGFGSDDVWNFSQSKPDNFSISFLGRRDTDRGRERGGDEGWGGGGLAILRLTKFRTLFYILVVITTDHAGWFSSRAHGSLPANSCCWAETLVHVVVQRIRSLPRCVLQSFCACRLLFSLGKIEQPFVLVLRHIGFFFFFFLVSNSKEHARPDHRRSIATSMTRLHVEKKIRLFDD